MFGAEQDGTSAVVDAVMAVLSARRLDSEGRVLAPPMNLTALLGLNGGDRGASATQLLMPPTATPEPEVRFNPS